MGTMFDTTDNPKAVFAGLQVEAIAAYGNGRYANYREAKQEYPHVPILEIDVSGAGIGDAGDFEPGDMTYADAGPWAAGRIKAGVHRPVVYFSVGGWPQIRASLEKEGLGLGHVRLWTAHYTGTPHLCSARCGFDAGREADATQWGTPGHLPAPYAGRNIDVSETAPGFFGHAR